MDIKKADNILTRTLFIFPLGVFGLMHFLLPEFFTDLVPDFVPGGIFWVYFSGFALTAASISIITRIWVKTSTLLLMIFVTTFIVSVDVPGMIGGDKPYYSFVSFLKDTSLLGGTYVFHVIFKIQ
jgi:hypothetical protein